MNKYTKLFIDNQEVDLFKSEDLPLNITKRVNNLDGKVQGDYSRASIKIPATKNNVAVLGNSRSFKTFRIEVDGSPSFSGTARVRKGRTFSQSYGAIKETYEINLVSNNSSWFVLLGDVLLSELTDEKIVDGFIDTNVSSGFLSVPDLRNWCFLLIKWRNWSHPVGTAPNIRYIIDWFDSTPALFIRPLIQSAFASIGYSIESEWLNSDLGKKLIIPTPIPKKQSKEFAAEYVDLKASFTGPQTFTNVRTTFPFNTIDYEPPSNPGLFDNVTSYQYTVPLSGYYKIDMFFELAAVPVPNPATYFVIASLRQNFTYLTPPIGFGYAAPTAYPGNVKEYHTGVVYAVAGDLLDVEIWTADSVTIEAASFSITAEVERQRLMPVDFKYLLRDWKFNDMLQGLTAIFNLAFETDEVSKVVRIEPKDGYVETNRIAETSQRKQGFYKNEGQKDYSKLIDYDKKGTFEFPNVKGSYNFGYFSDGEETINFLEENQNLKVYEARFKMGSGADSSAEENKQVPFFAKTIHVLDDLAKFPDTNVVPQFPLIYPQNYVLDPTFPADEDGLRTEAAPRILYFAGQRFGYQEIDGLIEMNYSSPLSQLVPMAFMVNYNDITGLDPNLGFNSEIINDVKSKGLLENYHLNDMTRLDKGEIRKNYVQFNSVDELVFSFRLKAFIDGQRYVVQEIKGFNPLIDAPTSFQFVLDVFPTQEDIDNIINTPVNSIVSLLSEIP